MLEDSLRPEPDAPRTGAPIWELIGYGDDGAPVFSRNGSGQYSQGSGGTYSPYAGTVNQSPPTTTPKVVPGPVTTAPGPGAGGSGGTPPPPGGGTPPPAPRPNVGGLITPFGTPFAPPPAQPYPNAPTFTPPSMEDAANDQGYMFSLNQGKKNLENWLAAHGTFNDSAAAEALQQYGQGAASTQYNNVWNRQYQAFQGALGPWQTNVGTIQHDNDMRWQDAFNLWLQNWNVFKDQRDSTFNKQYETAVS